MTQPRRTTVSMRARVVLVSSALLALSTMATGRGLDGAASQPPPSPLATEAGGAASPPLAPPGRGNCTDVSSTGFTLLYDTWPVNSTAAYVGLFRNDSTPLSQPSALLMATPSAWHQLHTDKGDSAGAVASAQGLLHPATTYTIRWRFRPALNDSVVNFGFGWGAWGVPFTCTTSTATAAASKASAASFNHSTFSAKHTSATAAGVGPTADTALPASVAHGAPAKTLRLYRSSEFTIDDVDFLSNHSSGDERGEVRWCSFVHFLSLSARRMPHTHTHAYTLTHSLTHSVHSLTRYTHSAHTLTHMLARTQFECISARRVRIVMTTRAHHPPLLCAGNSVDIV
jgi:hypothetical protein